MEESIKQNFKNLFKTVLYENIGKFESPKINPKEDDKIEFKGLSGEKAKEKAKEYTYKEFLEYLNYLYKTAKKNPKTIKVKHKKFKKGPRTTKGIKRRFYIPISIFSQVKEKIYKVSYLTVDTSPELIEEIKNEVLELIEEHGKDNVTFTFETYWFDVTPNPKCNVCKEFQAKGFDIKDFMLKGKWGLSHDKCDCKIKIILKCIVRKGEDEFFIEKQYEI